MTMEEWILWDPVPDLDPNPSTGSVESADGACQGGQTGGICPREITDQEQQQGRVAVKHG